MLPREYLPQFFTAQKWYLDAEPAAVDNPFKLTDLYTKTHLAAKLTCCRSACDATVYKKPKAKNCSTVSFEFFDSLSGDAVSSVTKGHLSFTPCTNKGSVMNISTNIGLVR